MKEFSNMWKILNYVKIDIKRVVIVIFLDDFIGIVDFVIIVCKSDFEIK